FNKSSALRNNRNFLRRGEMKEDRGISWKMLFVVFGVAGLALLAFLFGNDTRKIEDTGKVFSVVLTKNFLWLMAKSVIFFFAFVFFCHGPMVWLGFLFSVEDGKAKTVYTKDRILGVKITYYGRHKDRCGNIIEDEDVKISRLVGLFRLFKNYFFGSLHILGIPGIHSVDTEAYEWERLNPTTGKAEKAKSLKGELPLKEFIPSINFENLDVVGGQINVKIGPLIRITNPIKAVTVARDWFPFMIDIIRGHVRECFAPKDFFTVMIGKVNFGKDDEKKAEDLSDQIMSYFADKKVKDKNKNGEEKEFSLIEFIEKKYGIRIIKFYVIDPDPAGKSADLLNAISKPAQATLDAKEEVIKATGQADAFNKKREAMIKPGGELLRKLEALEKSRLVTLGDGGKGLNIFVDTKEGEDRGKH
ncbi:MAG: hypothetical protein AAB818_00930, partial [Patescibacteria group bacterium]